MPLSVQITTSVPVNFPKRWALMLPASNILIPVQAVENAECILVSGGNTWLLNQLLHENGLVVPIQRAIRERNIPYIGWSAGCNVATPSIRTTNDMPVRNCVVMPSLGLFPVQINPHYIDAVISGHMGETRDERIAEFCAINPDEIVVALREGSGFHITGNEPALLQRQK